MDPLDHLPEGTGRGNAPGPGCEKASLRGESSLAHRGRGNAPGPGCEKRGDLPEDGGSLVQPASDSPGSQAGHGSDSEGDGCSGGQTGTADPFRSLGGPDTPSAPG